MESIHWHENTATVLCYMLLFWHGLLVGLPALEECGTIRMNKSADNEFLFLSYSPNTRSRKDQELQEAERRAHAARRSHPSVRQRKSADSSPATAAANSPSPQDQLSDATDATHTNRNATQEIQRYSNRYNSTLAGPKVLRTLLGEGRYDPFSVFAVQDIPAYVHKMLDAGESASRQLHPELNWGMFSLTLPIDSGTFEMGESETFSCKRRRPSNTKGMDADCHGVAGSSPCHYLCDVSVNRAS